MQEYKIPEIAATIESHPINELTISKRAEASNQWIKIQRNL